MGKTIQFSPNKKLGIRVNGNRVQKIILGSQAEKVGVQVGWLVKSINGKIMPNDKATVKNTLANLQGQNIPLSIVFTSDSIEENDIFPSLNSYFPSQENMNISPIGDYPYSNKGSDYKSRIVDFDKIESHQKISGFKICFNFEANNTDPWGCGIFFECHWSSWAVYALVPGGQADRLGVKIRDRILAVDNVILNEQTSSQIESKLCAGPACQLLMFRSSFSKQMQYVGYLKEHEGVNKLAQPQFFVLGEYYLDYYADDSLKDKRGSILLEDISSIAHILPDINQKSTEKIFKITTLKKEYFLEAISDMDKNKWINHLTNQIAILKNKWKWIQKSSGKWVERCMEKTFTFYTDKTIGIRCERNRIQKILPESQAKEFDVKVGWIVVSINGETMPDDKTTTKNTLTEAKSHDIPITIVFAWEKKRKRKKKERKKKEKTLTFVPKKQIGIRCNGNQIQKIIPGSQSEKFGVKIGWVVVSINGEIMPNDKMTTKNALAKAKSQDIPIKIVFTLEKGIKKKEEERKNVEEIKKKKEFEKKRKNKLSSDLITNTNWKWFQKPNGVWAKRSMEQLLTFDPNLKIGIRCVGNQIHKIILGSQAEEAGVKVGWIIVSINGEIMPDDKTTTKNTLAQAKSQNIPISIVFLKVEKDILYSGQLTKLAGLGMRSHTRYFILSKTSLEYYVTNDLTDQKGSIDLSNILGIFQGRNTNATSIISTTKSWAYETTFSILTPHKCYVLGAPSVDENNNWIRHIKTKISKQSRLSSSSSRSSRSEGCFQNSDKSRIPV